MESIGAKIQYAKSTSQGDPRTCLHWSALQPSQQLCRIQQPQNDPSSLKEHIISYFEALTRNEAMCTSKLWQREKAVYNFTMLNEDDLSFTLHVASNNSSYYQEKASSSHHEPVVLSHRKINCKQHLVFKHLLSCKFVASLTPSYHKRLATCRQQCASEKGSQKDYSLLYKERTDRKWILKLA